MTTMTAPRRRGPVALAIVAIVLGSCGSGPPPAASNTPETSTAIQPSPSSATSPSPPPTASPAARPTAGEITAITTQKGFVDDTQANRGDGVFAGGSVRTDAKGSLQFSLNQKIKRCTLVTSTRVDILPSADVLLHYDSGTAVCTTTADSGTIKLAAGTNVDLRMSDPLYMVTVEPDMTRIRVVSGLVEVRSTETENVTYLGPSNRADVFPGGGPTDPEQWGTGELDPELEHLVDAEKVDLPKVDLTMPDPANSPVLGRIAEVGTLHVGLDERVFQDEPSADFARWFVTFQAKSWRLKNSDPRTVTFDGGLKALQSGAIDLFVTPAPDIVDGFGYVPFFNDRLGNRLWILFDVNDPVFGAAEGTFLRNTVTVGNYGSQYRRVFDAEAPYAAIAELFGLNRDGTSAPTPTP